MLANTVLLLNSLLCPPLGFLINFLLIWLILRRTPKQMAVHSRVLLQTCILDCLILTVETFGQVVIVLGPKDSPSVSFYDGYSIRLFQFLWAKHPSITFLIDFLWLILYHLSTVGISVQFVLRYLRLNRDLNVNLRHFLLLFLGPCLLITLNNFCLGINVLKSENVRNLDRQRFSQFIDIDEGQPPIYNAYVIVKDDLDLILFGSICLTYTVSYSVILFCGYKMVRFVHNDSTFNPWLKELNRQLTKNLIILAIIPLLLDIGIMIATILGLGSDGIPGMPQFQFYLFCAAHWLPVFNPLASIYVNRPYRDAVLGRFFKVARTPVLIG